MANMKLFSYISGLRQPSGTPSPKKRQLPQIPPKRSTRDQMTLELEERARQMKLRMQRRPDGILDIFLAFVAC